MNVMWKPVLVFFETLLVSAQDWCMICAKHTIGSKIILTHPMVLLGDVGQVKACSVSFGESVNHNKS
jgi:hypothetical protein